MADLRIVDAPDLPLEELTEEVKIPTGGKGNYAVKAGDVATYVEKSKDLANKTFVNNSSNGVKQQLDAHKNDNNNPHAITKDQIGLDKVNNTADLDKPVSNATSAAIITAVDTHKNDKNNPHGVTKAQIGLGNVDNTSDLNKPVSNAVDSLIRLGGVDYWKGGEYPLNGEVRLDNGDIVKSTESKNIKNPNSNMTGWVKTNSSDQLYFKQPEQTALQQTVLNHAKKIQYTDDYATAQNAVDAKRENTTDVRVTSGTFNIPNSLNINGYSKIEGSGDGTILKFEDAGNGIKYTVGSGMFDDHKHHFINDLRVQGDGTTDDFLTPKDGTTIGYEQLNTGHFGYTQGLTLERHDIGFKISNAYTNANTNNYYRANKVGLLLDNVTSHREQSVYARFNSEAGVIIQGGSTQNVTFAGGAIEGNKGRGLWVRSLPSDWYVQLQLDDLYMESNGDLLNGVPAIDVQSIPNMHITVSGGNYWQNTNQGIRNGVYDWGNSVSFEGTSLDGFHFSKYMSLDKVYPPYGLNAIMFEDDDVVKANIFAEPTIMQKYNPNTVKNHIFQVPFVSGITPNSITVTNTCKRAYPYNVQSFNVAITENTSLDYGEGSWDKAVFPSTGNYGSNYVELQAVSVTPNTFGLASYLFRAESDCVVGFVSSSSSTNMKVAYKFLANKTYKIVLPKVYSATSSGTDRLRIFLFDSATAVTLNYKPLLLANFTDKDVLLSVIDKLINGTDIENLVLKRSVPHYPNIIGAGLFEVRVVTLNGVVMGDTVVTSYNQYNANIDISAQVSGDNTVSVKFRNTSVENITPLSGTLTVKKI